MVRRDSGTPRAGRSTAPIEAVADFGPAWLSLRQALKALCESGDQNVAAVTLADAITTGRLTVFTDFLWRDENDSWDDGSVTRKQAEALGLVISDLTGPTNRSLALSQLFWHRISNLPSTMVDYREGQSLKLLEKSEGAGSKGQTSLAWDVHRPIVPALQVELLKALIDLGRYSPPKSPRVGRHRTEKWDDWTAQLAQHLHEQGISPDDDAGQLAATLEAKMQARFKEAPDRTSAKMTLETVIAHSALYIGEPQKS